MKFLLFNFVTGGALVYLVLAGGPPSVAIEGSQPVRTVSATAASDPGQQGGREAPPPEPVPPPIVLDADLEPESEPAPEPERAGAPTPAPTPIQAPVPAQEEDVLAEAQPAMMSPLERSLMLRDLARDMDAKFLQRN
jgi:hypothetical protein